MTPPVYSVIIPVYNAEKTLDRCVRSLLDQEHYDAEFILIDDGSADRSPEICDRYAASFAAVRCIHQENRGVSAARNAGIDAARGDFVTFVDSDDYVSPTYFRAIRQAEQTGSWDLLQLSHEKESGTHSTICQIAPCTAENRADSLEQLFRSFASRRINPPWGKVYRAEILRTFHVRFPDGLSIGEDWAFNMVFSLHVDRYCALDDVVYHLNTESESSLSRRLNEQKEDELSQSRDYVRSAVAASGLSETEKKKYYQFINFGEIRSVYRLAKTLQTTQPQRRERLKEIHRKCKEINEKRLSFPNHWRCKIMCILVRLHQAWLIDFAASQVTKRQLRSLSGTEPD